MEKANRRTIAGLVMSILAVCLLIASAVMYFTTPVNASDPGETQRAYLYTVQEYEGKVAVTRAGEAQPYQVYDTYISSLPEIDQQQLRQGIPIYSEEELRRAIEDYTS